MNTDTIITILSWAAPVAFAFHVIEELFWPGGFRQWYHAYRPQVAGAPMSYYYKANACYLAAMFTIPFAHHPAYSTLFGMGILFNNLVFTHVRGSLKTGGYSPGIATGLLLYLPLFVLSYGFMISQHVVSIPAALGCYALSCSGEIYFALKKRPQTTPSLSEKPVQA